MRHAEYGTHQGAKEIVCHKIYADLYDAGYMSVAASFYRSLIIFCSDQCGNCRTINSGSLRQDRNEPTRLDLDRASIYVSLISRLLAKTPESSPLSSISHRTKSLANVVWMLNNKHSRSSTFQQFIICMLDQISPDS